MQAFSGAAILLVAAFADGTPTSMVETGSVKDGQHVAFANPFPEPPDISIYVPDIEKYTAQLIVCSLNALNVTRRGFDFRADCSPTAHPDAVWTAMWMKPATEGEILK